MRLWRRERRKEPIHSRSEKAHRIKGALLHLSLSHVCMSHARDSHQKAGSLGRRHPSASMRLIVAESIADSSASSTPKSLATWTASSAST